MKKFFLMALSVFLFSTTASFAGNEDNSNKVANNGNNEIEVLVESSDYPYWQGLAITGSREYSKSVYLKVYNSYNACNSYVADIYRNSRADEKLGGATVRENPDYNPNSNRSGRMYHSKYYITYGGDTYYFNM